MTSQPLRDLISYKPDNYLSKLDIPVFAIFGEKDTQVDPKLNRQGMDEIFKLSGNDQASTLIIAGMNHVFQPAKSGLVVEYKNIDISVMPTLPETIADWIKDL